MKSMKSWRLKGPRLKSRVRHWNLVAAKRQTEAKLFLKLEPKKDSIEKRVMLLLWTGLKVALCPSFKPGFCNNATDILNLK